MSNSFFVNTVVFVFVVMWSLVTLIIIPYIQTKITSEQMNKLYDFVRISVKCAEQIYSSVEWKQKKEYVKQRAFSFINSTLHIKLQDEDLDAIIEGIVNEIKKG